MGFIRTFQKTHFKKNKAYFELWDFIDKISDTGKVVDMLHKQILNYLDLCDMLQHHRQKSQFQGV